MGAPWTHPAVLNLQTQQRQLDMDGCEVGVSRQAIDETLALLTDLAEAAQAVAKAREDYRSWVNGGPAGRAVLALMGLEDEKSLRTQGEAAFALLAQAIARATGERS